MLARTFRVRYLPTRPQWDQQMMFRRNAVILIAASALLTYLQTAPAAAQFFWDWGGGSEVGASGREQVRFNPQFIAGQIIVSFGDRRLYPRDTDGRSDQLSDCDTA